MSDIATQSRDRTIAEGVLVDKGDDFIVLAVPGTNYELRLLVPSPIDAPVGSKLRGRVRVRARRIDKIKAGGRYIEPVAGRPRRIQGRVTSVDEVNDVLVVRAAIPINCRTNGIQRAGMFTVDHLVSFDIDPDARFEPVE